MKIGIVTIIDNDNYGNRLQNYAVQEVIKKYGLETLTLKNSSYSNTKSNFLLRQIKNLNYKGTYSFNQLRRKKFEEFNQYIDFSQKKITAFSKCQEYDYFITGSDQVWNPNISRMRDVDLLSFVPPIKRISFSASISVNYLTSKSQKSLAKEVKKFKNISVREDRAKEIVEELTGRTDVEVLVDPTMLLSNEKWDKVSKKPEQLKTDRYILNYFLGELSESRKKEIERIAKENDCEVINILDKNSPFYQTGPSEFLYLEKNAFLICTDSFHSCVFAILYNRPFIVFDREENIVSMNSRIETLINKFNLKDRKYNGEKITEENLNHDYTEAYEILEKEREKANNFLKKALDIKE